MTTQAQTAYRRALSLDAALAALAAGPCTVLAGGTDLYAGAPPASLRPAVACCVNSAGSACVPRAARKAAALEASDDATAGHSAVTKS